MCYLIFQESRIISGKEVRYYLVGDPAYELQWYLMKDYPGRGLPIEKVLFNEKLNSQRVCVEIAFGRLKGRWRILAKKCDIDCNFVPQIVAACCTLHNIVETNGDDFPSRWHINNEDGESQQPATVGNSIQTASGNIIRDALCNHINQINTV